MEQPKRSKVALTKTNDTLEIYFPPARFRCYMTTVILGMDFILSFPILLMAYGVYAAEFPYKIICALFSIPFLTGAIGMSTFLLPLFFESSKINMDCQKIEISCKMFGKEATSPVIIAIENITELKRTEYYAVPNSEILKRPDIIFVVGEDEYKLRRYTNDDLPDNEIDWLAYEISDFLKLPITREES